MIKKGVDLQFNADIVHIDKLADGSLATLEDGRTLEADCIFYATGRRPMIDGLGLEAAGVALDARGFIAVDDEYRTSVPSILAIGDVIGRVQLTPVALAEGMAVARRLFKPEQYRKVDYSTIPTAVFSLPNMATVGLTEEQAREQGYKVTLFESRFRPMKLTMTDSLERSLMKLVVDAHTDRVLGCHMAGPDAGEIMQGLAVALKAGATKQVFDEPWASTRRRRRVRHHAHTRRYLRADRRAALRGTPLSSVMMAGCGIPGCRGIDLDAHFGGDLATAFELQGYRKTFSGHQWLLEAEKHHVIASRFEFHLARRRHLHRIDPLHLHHVALMHMGMQLGLSARGVCAPISRCECSPRFSRTKYTAPVGALGGIARDQAWLIASSPATAGAAA